MTLINLVKHRRKPLALAALPIALAMAIMAALYVGPYPIPFWEIFMPANEQQRSIVELIRLPRIVMALLVGGALAASGAVMQGLFRNPMAEPGVLGVSAGAALGAVLAIATGIGTALALTVPAFAFIGALAAIIAIHSLATLARQPHAHTLLLAGIAFTSFAGALISLLLLSTQDLFIQRQILFWLAGGLDTAAWSDVRWAAAPIAAGTAVMLYYSRELNLLAAGEQEARTMGVNLRQVRAALILAASLATGVAVAFTGAIGFIGLVVPHILRLAFGADNRILIPLSIAGGALFLLGADILARTIIAPAELRVGIVTALVGTPLFIYLLLRSQREGLT